MSAPPPAFVQEADGQDRPRRRAGAEYDFAQSAVRLVRDTLKGYIGQGLPPGLLNATGIITSMSVISLYS
jgi:hypothetical protein